MRDTDTGKRTSQFLAQPIDVPVAACHCVFLFASAAVALIVAACFLAGDCESLELASPYVWVAAISTGARDGIADAHRRIDQERGIAR